MRAGILLVLLSFVAASCRGTSAPAGDADSQSQAVIADGDTIRLFEGESVRVQPAGTLVAFDSVISDSRCRPDVTCVWAGSVRVRLTLAMNAGAGIVAELETNAEPRSVRVGTQRFTLLPEVEPAAGRAGRYRIALQVARE